MQALRPGLVRESFRRVRCPVGVSNEIEEDRIVDFVAGKRG